MSAVRAVLLDVDGTLVDTNYLHVIAWQRAFAGVDLYLPAWCLHRQIGKGGDKFVAAAAGDEVEREHGDALRDLHGDHFGELIEEARPLPGARDLLVALHERGVASVLASSGNAEEVEHYLDLLDARELLAGWTSSGDVSSSKPAPDLVEAALARVEARQAVMVGDSVWDGLAARTAGIGFIALCSGGISEAELRDAGARQVYDAAADLARDLDGAGLVGR